MAAGISLANKCQLLFGCAVLVILAVALSVPWIRTQIVVRESQIDVARQLSDAWLKGELQLGALHRGQPRDLEQMAQSDERDPLWITFLQVDQVEPTDELFAARAYRRFLNDASVNEHVEVVQVAGEPVYRYARSIRQSQLAAIRDPRATSFLPNITDPALADPLRAMLIIDRRSQFAEGQLLVGRVYIVVAGVLAGLVAIGVFYLILTKLILSPVRRLRETAERVRQGDQSIRADIHTGDEFEQLSEAFNAMLERVTQAQAQLQGVNQTLDLKVTELSEANIGLFESNRLKSEFLANVSHELRTPLNSIIGFAEVLDEIARGEQQADPKRLRYLANIISSGRRLLEMINELLDMAKIEAGRMEVNIEPTSVTDLIEGLANLLRPMAQEKSIELRTKVGTNIPMAETDPGKLQQILYNFLSNAIKFTPPQGIVTLAVERRLGPDRSQHLRLSVSDTGPGIPDDMQDLVFEKFRQVEAGHTRSQGGTGLGLAICRELAELLGASVSFVSESGHGATFYVDLPVIYQPEQAQALMS